MAANTPSNCPGRHGMKMFRIPNDSFSCDGCGAHIPRNGIANGCRICNFDLCDNCLFPETRESCPGRHGLNLYRIPNQSFSCDGCGRHINQYDIAYDCRMCNFDLCITCALPRGGGGGNEPVQQDSGGACDAAELKNARVVASVPEIHHDECVEIMRRYKSDYGVHMQKAFGRAGDMVDSLDGNGWVGKWQAKVVMAVAALVNVNDCTEATIFCIEGGPHCDKELAAQPLLIRAIRTELGVRDDFDISVEWMSFSKFQAKAASGKL
jgi:hypothetical protein